MRKIWICLFVFLSSYIYPDSFERIISLGTSITEELYLLGAGDKLIGVTTYCVRPEEAKKKLKVGTVTQIDNEKILIMEPDLVISTSLNNKKQVEKLKSMGVNIISFRLTMRFSDLCEQFLELGRLVGKEKIARDIIEKAYKRINRVENKVKNLPKVSVFVQVGARPLFTMAKDTFVNDYIELAGGVNIAAENKSGFYSREEVLKQNPDVILIVTMGITGAREKKMWERFKNLKAVRNNKVVILDSNKMCSPTPVSFPGMLEELTEVLHGSS